jgi:hypothetical protein
VDPGHISGGAIASVAENDRSRRNHVSRSVRFDLEHPVTKGEGSKRSTRKSKFHTRPILDVLLHLMSDDRHAPREIDCKMPHQF